MEYTIENTRLYKIIVAIVLLAFWGYGSGMLTEDPDLTLAIIPISLGMLTAIAVVVQLVLKENVQAKMKKVLNSEIEERREELLDEFKELVSYLEKTKYPSYSESGAEGLEDDFRQFDSIKSKYTFQPKIIHSTILTILSSLILVLFWMNPTLWIEMVSLTVIEEVVWHKVTLAHVGLGLLVIGLWLILSILVTSLEVKVWEKE